MKIEKCWCARDRVCGPIKAPGTTSAYATIRYLYRPIAAFHMPSRMHEGTINGLGIRLGPSDDDLSAFRL